MFDLHTKFYPLSAHKDKNVSRFIQLILSVMIYSIRHYILNWNKMFDLHTKFYPLPARKDKILSRFIQLILSVMIYSIRKKQSCKFWYPPHLILFWNIMIISLILCLLFFTMSSWVKFCMKVKHFIPIKNKCNIPRE